MPEIKLNFLICISFDDQFTDISQDFPLVPPSQYVQTGGKTNHTVCGPGPQSRPRQAVPGGGPRRVETDQGGGGDVGPTLEMFSSHHHHTPSTGGSQATISPTFSLSWRVKGGFSEMIRV